LRFWPAEAVVTFAAAVGAKVSEVVAALVAVAAAAAAIGRHPVAVVVKVDFTEAATAATFAVEVAAAAAGAGRFAAAAVVVVPDGNASSAFPDKSIQNR
jgi:hypothetical protein